MNKMQKDYIINRVDSIRLKKLSAIPNINIRELLTDLTHEQKREQILSRKATLNLSRYPSHSFNFIPMAKVAFTQINFDITANINQRENIKKYTTKLKDELILGNSEKAMQILAEFESS